MVTRYDDCHSHIFGMKCDITAMNECFVNYEVLQYGKGKLTLHVHIGRLVHEMHEELCSVDENLISAVTNGAIPPCSL